LALPPFEREFFVGFVTARIEGALKSRRGVQGDGGSRRGMRPDPWLSMRFKVTVRYVDRPSKGRWLAAELEDSYQRRVAEVGRQDELEAQKKAEEDKRMAGWTARREKERLEEEAKAERERQLAERTASQVAMRAERDAAARQQRHQEQVALREHEAALSKADWDQYAEGRRRQDEIEAELRRKEAEEKAKRLAGRLVVRG
jgi:hypothetical protein